MLSTLSLAISMTSLDDASRLGLIPRPLSVAVREGRFVMTDQTTISAGRSEQTTARLLADWLRQPSGLPLRIVNGRASGAITLRIDRAIADLGPEGYRLESSADSVVISAPTEAGLFYGAQTLRQLMPTDAFGQRSSVKQWSVPAVSITDQPRFRWRGAHLDVARHFMPKDVVKQYIDRLAMHKLNTFHWHLTDDQGWRIEIRKYPKLTEIGSWRADTMLTYSPATYAGKPHSGFYTQADVKEIVAYAKERHITVVPEIEMPGHAQAAIAAYPELGNTGKQLPVATKWGVIENVFNVEDRTISFLKDVLSEVMTLFPSEFIHIGGDECPKVQWKQSESAQSRMRSLGLKDEHELQSWFIRQMDAFLEQKGRRLIGWSEILEGGLAPGAALMVWLGDDGAMQAVSSGHDVVMAQTSHTYFDYYQSRDTKHEPHAIGGFLPLDKVYSYEPILAKMTPDQAKHVMGVQFQIWTEYIPNGEHVEYMAYPRACALAEVAWSAKDQRNFDDFIVRLNRHLPRLTAHGVNFRKLDAGLVKD